MYATGLTEQLHGQRRVVAHLHGLCSLQSPETPFGISGQCTSSAVSNLFNHRHDRTTKAICALVR